MRWKWVPAGTSLILPSPRSWWRAYTGDSHPGSYHLNQMVEQAVYGVYEKGGKPAKYYATDICDGCTQGHDGMNFVLASGKPSPTWWKSTAAQCPGTA